MPYIFHMAFLLSSLYSVFLLYDSSERSFPLTARSPLSRILAYTARSPLSRIPAGSPGPDGSFRMQLSRCIKGSGQQKRPVLRSVVKMDILTAGSVHFYASNQKNRSRKTICLFFIQFWNFILAFLCHNASRC